MPSPNTPFLISDTIIHDVVSFVNTFFEDFFSRSLLDFVYIADRDGAGQEIPSENPCIAVAVLCGCILGCLCDSGKFRDFIHGEVADALGECAGGRI